MKTYQYEAFISYNSKDKDIAQELARWLKDAGINVWLDAWKLIPGKPWQEAIENALETSRTIVILIGKAGFGKWENEEARVAVESQVSDVTRSVIPVLLPDSDSDVLKGKFFLNRNTWVDFRNGLDDKDIMARLISGIKQREPGDINSRPQENHTKDQSLNASNSNDGFVPFTNREDEIEAILSSSSAQYHLIHAPSGYGKSRLLIELNKRFEEKGWHHAYVSVSKNSSLNEIALFLSEGLKLSVNGDADTKPGLKLGAALNSFYTGSSSLTDNPSGIALLIDLDKEPSVELLGKILEEFIPDIKRTIDTSRHFRNDDISFRVIVAGRYLAMTKEAKSTNLPLDQRALTPFTYNYVKKTIDTSFSERVPDERRKLAAHIIYMTGGHPNCMAKMYLLYKRNPISVDEFIETCKQEIRHTIALTVEDVQDSLPRDNETLIKALESLMVFRNVNYAILDDVRNKHQLDVGDTFDFEDILTKNHLFTRKQPYSLQDDVTRRLISTHLRDSQPDVYLMYCSEARQLCEKILRGDDVQSPTEWTLEYMFQWLQEHSVDDIRTKEKRLNLRSEFFNDILLDALDLYLIRHVKLTKNKVREDQNALLSELALSRQWEFEFLVNYCLRDDLYDDESYKELKERISDFFDRKSRS